jgi:peptidoglycan hydrolase-like amidase
LRWFCAALLSLASLLFPQTQTRTVRIGVLGIFHPRQMTLSADRDGQLLVLINGRQFFLQSRSACSMISIRLSGDKFLVNSCGNEIRADLLRATGRNQQPAGFVIAIPGKISRRYEGLLEVTAKGGELIPVVTMNLETAVASVVQAEANPGTPIEALKAQAVVSRSYLTAGAGRHKNFDFCDLTHCQSLREPPSAESPAAQAAFATQSLVLTFDGKPIATMFARSCGGRTRTPLEIGLPQADYPYFSVACDYCTKDPARWTRKLSAEDTALLTAKGESGRLTICRRLGWNAVPSNNFTTHNAGDEFILEGTGQGHGVGLCQRGARYMADQSSDFHEILSHYFPRTKVEALGSTSETPH